MPVVGAPDIEASLGALHATLALVVFVAPGAIALVIEPLLFLLADRYPRRWFIRGGIAVMALASLAAAAAPGAITLSLALAVSYVASGTAISLGQATLVDREPGARTLARWSLWSIVGDLAAPALLAALAFAGATWRMGFAIAGALLAVWAVLLAAAPFEDVTPTPDDEPKPSLLATLKDALSDRLLLAWLFGSSLCDLLDEILIVFASLHVRVDLHAGVFWQSAVVGAFVGGGILGLVALDHVLRRTTERHALVLASLACVATYLPWLAVSSPLAATLLAIPVGACSAPLYPLAAAQAYARRPNQSGSVLAASHLFTPLGLALPFLVGALADVAGTTAALAVLVLEPVGLIVLVGVSRRLVAPRVTASETTDPRTPDSTQS